MLQDVSIHSIKNLGMSFINIIDIDIEKFIVVHIAVYSTYTDTHRVHNSTMCIVWEYEATVWI